jgi:hypothetical protein
LWRKSLLFSARSNHYTYRLQCRTHFITSPTSKGRNGCR